MDINSTLLTVDWLNHQLDKIINKTEFIDEMIKETEDENTLFFFQKKLELLDKECVDIGNKIDFEKKQLMSIIKEAKL
jgi:hypothetical protein